jgi:hypothetical protein
VTLEQTILSKLDRLTNDVARLRQELVKKSTDEWISGDAVITLTGWDSKKLRKLREQELVKVKREGHKVRYSRQSVIELLKLVA